jgi:peptidoglycan hydrolase-like protein with peptidoglycan-binding domain
MPAAAQTNTQTTPLQRTQQEQPLAQQQGQTAGTGLSRDQILEVQQELLRKGYYSGPVDGIFGPKTERALREFQKDQQLPVTGQIGGLSRNQIREVQRALLRKGYDAGPEDESFGPWTARALRQFQKAQQLPVTEQLDDRSLAALQIGQREVGGEKNTGPQQIPTPTSPSTPRETSAPTSPSTPQEASTPASPSTPQETSAQRSPDNHSSALNQKPNAPEEPIAGEGAKRSWWRSLWERLWGR